ncbi:hypothetical protein SCA6_009735 [Theobroma cacao]|uniref:Uncharacterized protein LOC18592864 n=3 Tax=Theobroma cacao TaxID=3641 RepID=A0AB32UWM0_THECC|nr:PREDICTED: uncharacterized protein LOC18592864 [Theobroma cacao]EOY17074.1 Leucine-rich repeat structural protein ORF147 isoform 1 [Theobroma cacao]
MGKLIGEKALEQYHGHHHHNQHGCCYNYSLEEKVSEFLDSNNFAESDACLNQETIDGYGSDGNESNDPIERTLYWESQEALLQEILERYVLTGSKLRQEICRIIEVARETDFCSCTKPSIDGCTHCLRKRVISLLCDRGLNASLCVSKWKHTKKHPGGTHEYIEVIASTQGKKKQVPFVIELEFRDQFEIAKACDEYSKLVEQLPKCYAGKADYLNAMVGVMCDAAKRSMEEKNLHMGPWRKRSFMQMKWSNSSEPRSTE